MEIIYFLQGFASPGLDLAAQSISDLGSERGYIALLLAVYLGYDASIGQRVGVYLLLTFTLNFHLKGVFDTPRPFVLEPELYRSTEEELGPAFPSGHAMAATAFWGYLAIRIRQLWFWLVAVLVIALVSLTRIYLGLHFAIDVIGGVLLGTAVVVAARGIDRLARRISVPTWSVLVGGILAPLLTNVYFPPPGDESGLLMGGLAAFLTAPVLWRHRVPTDWWRRVVLVVFGVAFALALLALSSLALPEDVKRDAIGGFLRYLALGYVGLLLTPWLAWRMGLAARAHG